MRTLILLLFVFVANTTLSQVNISSQIDAAELVCPGTQVPYQINLPSGAVLCSINWQIVDGVGFFQDGNQTNPQAIITWEDQKPNKVEVEATVSYIVSEDDNCNDSDDVENVNVNFTHILRSVFQETIPNVSSSVNIPYD